jgi:two-component system alkaline phosphatase synthesis response regulator PhoP
VTNEKHHILVADDEPHIGRIIKMKLEQGPFNVTLAFDGEEAIQTLDKDVSIDIVLLDLMMPRKSGLDVLDHMHKDQRLDKLPRVILTAAGQEQQRTAAMDLGATEFVTKPFSPKKLYAMVERLTGVSDEPTGQAGARAD